MKHILILLNVIIFIQLFQCKQIDVKTSSGLVRGQTIDVLNQTLNQFLGIPFAEPPIGDLRFAKPKPIDKPLPVSKPINSIKLIERLFHRV